MSTTNNDVEKLLGISDATATRYFEELEQEGKVRQIGDTGAGVYYEKIWGWPFGAGAVQGSPSGTAQQEASLSRWLIHRATIDKAWQVFLEVYTSV